MINQKIFLQYFVFLAEKTTTKEGIIIFKNCSQKH